MAKSGSPFVADGYSRACVGTMRLVRAEVEAEYADKLAEASFWARFRLRREMAREIRRRFDRLAPPPDALY